MYMAFGTNDTFVDGVESLQITHQGTCRRCRKQAKLICMRCEDCYCSKKCQDMDWKSHRYICFPKPPLLEMDAASRDDNMPDLSDMEPIHLAEQLRSMINVCQDFLKRLDEKSSCKCNEKGISKDDNKDCGTNPFIPTRKDFVYRKGDNHLNGNLNGNGRYKHEEEDEEETSSTYKGNDAYKKALTARNFSHTNVNDNCVSTPDDSTVTELKVNMKHTERHDKKLKSQEATLIKGNKSAMNASICFTENSISDVCSIASSKTDSDNCDDDVVYLTSFRSANRVAVCLKRQVQNGTLDKIIDQIDKYGQNAPKISGIPETNSFVIALRSNKYARAKVVTQKHNNTERIRVDFVDFGNLAYRKLSELREILPALAELPLHVSVVQLSRVDLINYDDRILRFFSTFEKKYYKMKKLARPINKAAVELYDYETGESMNELIIQEFKKNETSADASKTKPFKNKTPVKDDDNVKTNKNDNKENVPKQPSRSAKKPETGPVLKAPFKHHLFSKNARNLKAFIVDTSMAEYGYFACILQSNLIHLTEIHNYFEKFVDPGEPYTPIDNEYVIAKFEDGSWYRGKVIGISADSKQIEISYIDYLNVTTLTCQDIRRYPDDLNIDCYTNLCVLINLSDISPELRQQLKANLKQNDAINIDRVVDIIDGEIAEVECLEFVYNLTENRVS